MAHKFNSGDRVIVQDQRKLKRRYLDGKPVPGRIVNSSDHGYLVLLDGRRRSEWVRPEFLRPENGR